MKSPRSFRSPAAGVAGLACLLLSAGVPAVHAQNNPAAPAADAGRDARDAVRDANERARRAEEKFLRKAHAASQREFQLSQLAVTRAADPRVRSFAQQLVTEHQQREQELQPLLTAAGIDLARPKGPMPVTDSSSSGNRPSGAESPTATDSGAGAGRTSATAGRSDSAGYATGNGELSSANTAGTAGGTAYGTDDPTTKEAAAGVHDRWSRMLDERKQRKLMEKSGADFDKTYLNLMVDEHGDAVDLFREGAEDHDNVQLQSFAAKYLPKLRQHLEQAEQLEKAMN